MPRHATDSLKSVACLELRNRTRRDLPDAGPREDDQSILIGDKPHDPVRMWRGDGGVGWTSGWAFPGQVGEVERRNGGGMAVQRDVMAVRSGVA